MTRRALIGHTGFVGSNLDRAGEFTDRFNSKNIAAMSGERFDEVVCAGVSAVKWLANKEPERDWAGIEPLLAALGTVEAERFTFISTIDVYPDPAAPLDEDAALDGLDNHAYGRHRLAIERFVRERFPGALIVRLPALFGPGLRKNALFDLLHDNATQSINPAGVFQWYPVEQLAADIETARAADLRLVNLFPEPIAMSAIIAEHFPQAEVGAPKEPAPRYDLRTRSSALFGRSDGYIMGRDAVAAAIGRFVATERAASRT